MSAQQPVNEHGQRVGPDVPGWTPRPRPRPGPFDGRYCRVVPLEQKHAPELYPSCAAPGTEALWTYLADGPYVDPDAFAMRIADTAADPDSESVAVLVDGRAAGLANYLRIDPANGSVEVGGILLGTTLQRTVAATEAMYLMARHVFEDLGYRRYEWKCDALNTPSRAAAARLGFRYEGAFRNAVVTKGRSRDTAWFSITDAEWPRLADAFHRWLNPTNFDRAGRQRVRLSSLTAALTNSGTGVPNFETRGTLA